MKLLNKFENLQFCGVGNKNRLMIKLKQTSAQFSTLESATFSAQM